MKYGERKPIPKATRQQVYDKYHGHCAYCGRKIEMKEMQVDHIIPIAYSCYGPRDKAEEVRKMFEDESINAIGNLMPACRACNFYKSINDIERFRNRIKSELDHTCRHSFQTRLAMQYGIMLCHKCHKEVHCNPWRNIELMKAKAEELGIDLKERYDYGDTQD